jgi:hypothetical protein
MSPPQAKRMVQKIRRLAASLGIRSRPPLGDAAAGVRLRRQSADEPNLPAAHVQATARKQLTSDHGKHR